MPKSPLSSNENRDFFDTLKGAVHLHRAFEVLFALIEFAVIA